MLSQLKGSLSIVVYYNSFLFWRLILHRHYYTNTIICKLDRPTDIATHRAAIAAKSKILSNEFILTCFHWRLCDSGQHFSDKIFSPQISGNEILDTWQKHRFHQSLSQKRWKSKRTCFLQRIHFKSRYLCRVVFSIHIQMKKK